MSNVGKPGGKKPTQSNDPPKIEQGTWKTKKIEQSGFHGMSVKNVKAYAKSSHGRMKFNKAKHKIYASHRDTISRWIVQALTPGRTDADRDENAKAAVDEIKTYLFEKIGKVKGYENQEDFWQALLAKVGKSDSYTENGIKAKEFAELLEAANGLESRETLSGKNVNSPEVVLARKTAFDRESNSIGQANKAIVSTYPKINKDKIDELVREKYNFFQNQFANGTGSFEDFLRNLPEQYEKSIVVAIQKSVTEVLGKPEEAVIKPKVTEVQVDVEPSPPVSPRTLGQQPRPQSLKKPSPEPRFPTGTTPAINDGVMGGREEPKFAQKTADVLFGEAASNLPQRYKSKYEALSSEDQQKIRSGVQARVTAGKIQNPQVVTNLIVDGLNRVASQLSLAEKVNSSFSGQASFPELETIAEVETLETVVPQNMVEVNVEAKDVEASQTIDVLASPPPFDVDVDLSVRMMQEQAPILTLKEKPAVLPQQPEPKPNLLNLPSRPSMLQGRQKSQNPKSLIKRPAYQGTEFFVKETSSREALYDKAFEETGLEISEDMQHKIKNDIIVKTENSKITSSETLKNMILDNYQAIMGKTPVVSQSIPAGSMKQAQPSEPEPVNKTALKDETTVKVPQEPPQVTLDTPTKEEVPQSLRNQIKRSVDTRGKAQTKTNKNKSKSATPSPETIQPAPVQKPSIPRLNLPTGKSPLTVQETYPDLSPKKKAIDAALKNVTPRSSGSDEKKNEDTTESRGDTRDTKDTIKTETGETLKEVSEPVPTVVSPRKSGNTAVIAAKFEQQSTQKTPTLTNNNSKNVVQPGIVLEIQKNIGATIVPTGGSAQTRTQAPNKEPQVNLPPREKPNVTQGLVSRFASNINAVTSQGSSPLSPRLPGGKQQSSFTPLPTIVQSPRAEPISIDQTLFQNTVTERVKVYETNAKSTSGAQTLFSRSITIETNQVNPQTFIKNETLKNTLSSFLIHEKTRGILEAVIPNNPLLSKETDQTMQINQAIDLATAYLIARYEKIKNADKTLKFDALWEKVKDDFNSRFLQEANKVLPETVTSPRAVTSPPTSPRTPQKSEVTWRVQVEQKLKTFYGLSIYESNADKQRKREETKQYHQKVDEETAKNQEIEAEIRKKLNSHYDFISQDALIREQLRQQASAVDEGVLKNTKKEFEDLKTNQEKIQLLTQKANGLPSDKKQKQAVVNACIAQLSTFDPKTLGQKERADLFAALGQLQEKSQLAGKWSDFESLDQQSPEKREFLVQAAGAYMLSHGNNINDNIVRELPSVIGTAFGLDIIGVRKSLQPYIKTLFDQKSASLRTQETGTLTEMMHYLRQKIAYDALLNECIDFEATGGSTIRKLGEKEPSLQGEEQTLDILLNGENGIIKAMEQRNTSEEERAIVLQNIFALQFEKVPISSMPVGAGRNAAQAINITPLKLQTSDPNTGKDLPKPFFPKDQLNNFISQVLDKTSLENNKAIAEFVQNSRIKMLDGAKDSLTQASNPEQKERIAKALNHAAFWNMTKTEPQSSEQTASKHCKTLQKMLSGTMQDKGIFSELSPEQLTALKTHGGVVSVLGKTTEGAGTYLVVTRRFIRESNAFEVLNPPMIYRLDFNGKQSEQENRQLVARLYETQGIQEQIDQMTLVQTSEHVTLVSDTQKKGEEAVAFSDLLAINKKTDQHAYFWRAPTSSYHEFTSPIAKQNELDHIKKIEGVLKL